MAEVAADALKKAGFNVEVQFSGLGHRDDTAAEPGSARARRLEPLRHLRIRRDDAIAADQYRHQHGLRHAPGPAGPATREAERLRGAVVDAPDEPSRKAAIETLHKRLAEMQPYRVLGQFDQPYARRTNISGVLSAPVMLFWNIEKK